MSDTPFAVGNQTRFIHDVTRGYDSVAGVHTGVRTLITEVWYPVDRDALTPEHPRATYGDYVFGDRAMHRLMMTGTTFFHLTPATVAAGVTEQQINAAISELFDRTRASYVDAPLAETNRALPVVVMSHGDAGSRYNMESACEYLAAHGYVVIAPEHTGNSPFSMTGKDPALRDPAHRERMAGVLPLLDERGAYGTVERFGQSFTPLVSDRSSPEFLSALDASLLQRVNDLRAALAELERMNASGAFAGRLNLTRPGLMGRSFGGSTTLAAMALEDRFAAGMAVVPPSMPDPRAALPASALAPAGQESAILSRDGAYALGEITKPMLLLSGSEDTLIIGLGAATAASAGTAVPTPDNPHPVIRAAWQTTDAPAVWAMLRDSNHATFGVSGDFWWPALKPNSFPRHFDPDTTYETVDVPLAHRMQRELALDFFDAMLRRDRRARTRLADNRYEADGLELEARNL